MPDGGIVACPNQDVVYGSGSLGLEKSPVVIQVPDFGNRFCVYQAVDLRSEETGYLRQKTPTFHFIAKSCGNRWFVDASSCGKAKINEGNSFTKSQ
jgi:hypothetical protein